MRDLYHNEKLTRMLGAVAQTADGTSASMDLQGFDSAVVNVDMGASGDTLSGSVKWELYLQESTDGTVFTAVADADVIFGSTVTAGLFATVDATDEDDTNFEIGYIGDSQYVHVKIDATGTHTNGTPLSILGIAADPAQAKTK